MNRLIKDILLVALGAAVGSGVTYAVIKHKLEQQSMDDEWNKERSKVLKEKAMESEQADISETEEEKSASDPRTLAHMAHNKPDLAKTATERAGYHDYTKYYKKVDDGPVEEVNPQYGIDEAEDYHDEDEPTKEELMIKPEEQKNYGNAPRIITEEEYGENEMFDRVSLYFHSDDVLVDENGDVMETENTVSEDILDALVNQKDHEIFVVNPRYGCYYDIVEVDTPFYPEE
jgi:hypothetical protein